MIISILMVIGMFILAIEAGICLAILHIDLEKEKKDSGDKD